MKEYITTLVRQALNDLLNKEPEKRKQILILLPNSFLKYVWENTQMLIGKYHVTFCISDKSDEAFETGADIIYFNQFKDYNFTTIIDKIDLLYVPSISHGFLAKLALLIDDTESVRLTLQVLLEGKPVLLGMDTIRKKRVKIFWPKPSINRRIKEYEKQLKEDGVHFCSIEKVEQKVEQILKKIDSRRPVILAQHMEELGNDKVKEVVLPRNSIITPMARDTARTQGITIKKAIYEKRDDL